MENNIFSNFLRFYIKSIIITLQNNERFTTITDSSSKTIKLRNEQYINRMR